VVEGPDDLHVVSALMQYHKFEPRFGVRSEGGIENLLKRLPVLLKAAGAKYERIGILVDADLDHLARWASLKGILSRGGYTGLPDSPDPLGTIVEQQDMPRVGIWLMPDNRLPGMLEDYVALLVPEGDPLFVRAGLCLDEIPVIERRFIENHRTKAHIHTWLAWQSDPGTPLGLAITKRYLDPESPHVTPFLDWLKRLFA
jgi:hypothetical protein